MNETRAAVSIIIPHFNQKKQLLHCLEKLEYLLGPNDEVIVVDDNSGFSPSEGLSKDPKINFILLYENRGPAHARNIGVAAAKNDFVAFLDADDIPKEYRFDYQVTFLMNNPICCACLGGYTYLRNNNFEVKDSFQQSNDVFKDICAGNLFAAGSTLLFKKNSFLDIGGYDDDLRVYEDWDLLIRAKKVGKLGHCGRSVASISSSSKRSSASLQLSTINILYDRHIHQLSRDEKCLFRQALYYERASAYLRNRDFIAATRELILAFYNSPYKLIRRLVKRVFFSAPQ